MRFVSHLDLMRLFQRASRRASLPVTVTKGYSPHLKISIARALKLGLESESEEAIFYLDCKMDPAEFVKSINDFLPFGIKFINAENIGD